MSALCVTAIAPANMATIKYWGKRDVELILPLNDSISVTLSTEQVNAKTTVMISNNFDSDRIWLNGKEESIENTRLQNCLNGIRKLSEQQNNEEYLYKWKVHICSENNFPTAAGLASSAAGYACLVFALSKLMNVEGDITGTTRMGSGSACRSIHGGYVRWHAGVSLDGTDSIATQIAPASHWPNLRILVLVVNDSRKKVGSTVGMQNSANTSEFLKYRVQHCVPKHANIMTEAIMNKDFIKFAEMTMRDSNQFHSVCLDSYPPVVYLNDLSHRIINFVHDYNKASGTIKAAYSFDAGPNACLFVLEENVDHLLESVVHAFPPHNYDNYVRGIQSSNMNINETENEPGLLKYIIHTKVGDGPQVLSDNNHLLTAEGLPKQLH